MDPSFYPFASLGAPELGATTQQRLASQRSDHSDYSSLVTARRHRHEPSGGIHDNARFAGDPGWRHERRFESRQLDFRGRAGGQRVDGVGAGADDMFANGGGGGGGVGRRQLLAGSDTQSHIDLIRTATAQYKRQIDRQFMGTPASMARLRGRGRAGAAASSVVGGGGPQTTLRPINGGDRLPVSCCASVSMATVLANIVLVGLIWTYHELIAAMWNGALGAAAGFISRGNEL